MHRESPTWTFKSCTMARRSPLGVAALDGVPIDDNGVGGRGLLWKSHILVPPAGRVEFILKGPPLGTHATLMTRGVDTGPAGENDPSRPLATIVAATDAPEPRSKLAAAPIPAAPAKPRRAPGCRARARAQAVLFREASKSRGSK